MNKTKLPTSSDPFRHKSLSNSHNHHDLHPWGSAVKHNPQEFGSLYAQANNQFMYHLWYNPMLAPYMVTELVIIKALSDDTIKTLEFVLRKALQSGIDVAIQTREGEDLKAQIQSILDHAPLHPDDRIFVRLGATSAKDSFALNVPTTKPYPMAPDADMIVRRLLTSARCVGRLLALTDGIWPSDPGEALVIQKWSPDIDLRKNSAYSVMDVESLPLVRTYGGRKSAGVTGTLVDSLTPSSCFGIRSRTLSPSALAQWMS